MAAKPSKFSTIFDAPQDSEADETIIPQPEAVLEPEAAAATMSAVAAPAPSPEPQSPQPTGRAANGKKKDPRYRQVTAYVRKEIHGKVIDALNDEVRGRDAKRKEFSELVDELLERWWQEWQERQGQLDRTD